MDSFTPQIADIMMKAINNLMVVNPERLSKLDASERRRIDGNLTKIEGYMASLDAQIETKTTKNTLKEAKKLLELTENVSKTLLIRS